MNTIKQYVQENKQRFIDELIELLKIPSVSADAAYAKDVISTSEAVKISLEKAGCNFVEICETPGYPIVFGEHIIDKNLPTVLVYGHYDVQPADPIELWTSPPFEPVIKATEIHPEGAIFARGSCDDKGQMYMHVKAFEYMIANNNLPCNVKFMIEGEEEVGSKSLSWFVERNQEKLSCDVILISRKINRRCSLAIHGLIDGFESFEVAPLVGVLQFVPESFLRRGFAWYPSSCLDAGGGPNRDKSFLSNRWSWLQGLNPQQVQNFLLVLPGQKLEPHCPEAEPRRLHRFL